MVSTQMGQVEVLLRKYVGVGLGLALLVPALLAIAGVVTGLLFPKFEATALLQFPEAQKSAERPGEPRLPEQRPWIPRPT